jgi:hypothetical protein
MTIDMLQHAIGAELFAHLPELRAGAFVES